MKMLFEFISKSDTNDFLEVYEGLIDSDVFEDTSEIIDAIQRNISRLNADKKTVLFVRYRHIVSGMSYLFRKWDLWKEYTPDAIRNEF